MAMYLVSAALCLLAACLLVSSHPVHNYATPEMNHGEDYAKVIIKRDTAPVLSRPRRQLGLGGLAGFGGVGGLGGALPGGVAGGLTGGLSVLNRPMGGLGMGGLGYGGMGGYGGYGGLGGYGNPMLGGGLLGG